MNGADDNEQAIVEARQLARAGQYGAAIRLLADAIEHRPLPARPEPVEGRSPPPASGPENRAFTGSALADGRERIIRAFAGLAAGLVPSTYRPELDRGLTACFAEEELDCQPLARCAAASLLLKYPQATLQPLGEDPLWIGFLTRCINTDARMEARLASMRRMLLVEGDSAPAGAIAALALQAFAGEYVWPISSAEAERLQDGCSPLLRALYAPPAEDIDGPDELMRLLVRSSLLEPAEERRLAEAMPTLGIGQDQVSAAVRRQYEEHPYPRWRIRPAPRPAALLDVLARLPGVDGSTLPPPPLAVLVAGCGTGFEAIEIARTDADAMVTALDLSRASLAYGKRMAGDVPNLRFVQGDILNVSALGESFDLVTSTGVLHHMESPDDGLRALRDVTKPGGVLRIALYSERARAPVCAAHAVIRARGLSPSDDGIRTLRDVVLAAPEGSPVAVLRQSDDFYSMSGCRDLLFHVREHLFTLPKVADLVARAGLKLVGFDVPPDALRSLRRTFGPDADPLDLAAWDRLEQRQPFLFAGMYHVWLQKPA